MGDADVRRLHPAGKGADVHGPETVLRVPPNNRAAEESALGAMLLSRDAIEAVFEVLGPNGASAFYTPAHGHVYDAVVALWSMSRPADVITVHDQLERKGLIDAVGGPGLLVTLQTSAPAVSNAGRYARIIFELGLLRRGIEFAASLSEACYQMPDDVHAMLAGQEATLTEVVHGAAPVDQLDTWDLFLAAYDRAEELRQNGVSITGLPTGFKELDELTSGLQPGTVIIVGARPAVGKSAFALNVVAHCILRAPNPAGALGRPAAVFTLEMSQLEVANRLIAAEGGIKADRLRNGQLDENDMHKLSGAVSQLGAAALLVDDNASTTVADIRSKARRFKAKHGDLGLVVVDYVQLMGGDAESRTQELARISRGFKLLARELQAPVMVLAQVSRGVEARADKRPNNSDLKDSGAFEQDADVILLLYRDEVYNKDSPAKGVAEVHVSKHRAGGTKTIRLAYLNHVTRFANMAISRADDPDPTLDESGEPDEQF